jgi:hypothetical protein
VLSTLVSDANLAAVDTLQRVTPLAWQHVNFDGRYRFDGDFRPVDLAKIVSRLAMCDSKNWG